MNDQLPATTQPQLTLFQSYTEGLQAKLTFCGELLKGGMIPQHFKTPQAVLSVMLRGQELGFSPMQSLEMFNNIQGQPTLKAVGMQALAVARGGGVFTILEETDEACEVKAVRPANGYEGKYRFTLKDAERAGLLGKDNWKKWPKAMMYARCISVLCRRGWPDVIGGLNCHEEMLDEAAEVPAFLGGAEVLPPKPELVAKPKKDETEHQARTRVLMGQDNTWVYDWNLAKKEMDAEAFKNVRKAVFLSGAVADEQGYLHTQEPVPTLEAYFFQGPGRNYVKTEETAAA